MLKLDAAKFSYQGITLEERAELQVRKLRELATYLDTSSPYWHQAFADASFAPDGIQSAEDLARAPWLDKHRYLAAMEGDPPYGGLLTAPLEEIEQAGAILFHTTGTSGRQGRFINTVAGFELYGDEWARCIATSGVQPGERVMACFPFSIWAATWGCYYASRLLPFTLVPGGAPIHKELRWELLARYRPALVTLTPSFALHLGKLAAEDDFDLAGVGVRRLLLGGEAFADARRRDIEEMWGCPGGTRNFYGLSEGGSMLAGVECEQQDGMHLFEDRAVHQFWDPDAEEGRLVAPGELGEYTFTNLDQRILATWFNFRTRDSAIYTDEPCSCGRPGRRMWIHDRFDDMRKIRGINVFASGVEALVREIPSLAEEFQLVVDSDEVDRVNLTVQAEAKPGLNPSDLAADARLLREKLRTAFGLRMDVDIQEYGKLPRWEGKARRWDDRRPKD